MLNLGLIGCGYWGKNYVSTIKNIPELNLKYVNDLKLTNIPLSESTIYTKNLEDVLKDQEVKGVMIVTPTITHYSLAAKALENGKHVLVEKPMTSNTKDAERLCEIAQANNVNLMVGHVFKYNTAVKIIQEKIFSGEMGELRYIEARRVGLGPIRQDVDVLWDFASHDIYIANMFVGKRPSMVSCIGISHNGKLDDISSLNLKYENPDVMATIYVNWEHPVKERKIIIGGSEKAILFDDIEPADKLKIFDRGVNYLNTKIGFGTFQAITKQGDTLIPKLNLNPPLEDEIRHFGECMNGAKCLSDGYEGLSVVEILEAAEKSKKNGGLEVKIK